ncbi:hypothetical protein MMC07_004981 [Pseudocyphellaria aurata]|nr:hypothetical protein [Pseudocyphellaria aurata]
MAESYPFLRNNDGSSPSSSRTPSPIPARRPSKSVEVRTRLDPDVTIEASNDSSKRFAKPKETLAPSPSSKSDGLNGARLRGRAPIIYDMKYHPMDDVLRPNAHATLNARSQRLISASREDSATDLENLKENEAEVISNSDVIRNKVHFSKNQPTRSSTRFAGSGTQSERRVNYDMRHHPIDDVLRSKSRKSDSSWLEEESISASAPSSTGSPRIDFDNPFNKPISSDWRDLESFDRRLYILQKGAPLHGETLPVEWTKIVETLVMEGFFTPGEFKALGGLTALTSRYETIRLEIQGFFRSAPEPVDKRNWLIKYVEDLEIYGLGSGTKYWRHQSDSVVNPRSSKIANRAQIIPASNEAFENRNAAHFKRIERLTLPDSAVSHINEASHEPVLEGQFEGCKGQIGRLPDDQGHSFEEAFDLLQPKVDADSIVDTIGDPFIWSSATNNIPERLESYPAEAIKGDRLIPCPSDSKRLIKRRNRDAKAEPSATSFQILEDEPGSTPLIRKYISMIPASPGTDIQKENLEDRRSPSEGDLSDNYRLIRLRSREHLVAISRSPQTDRFRAVRAVPPRESIGSP